MIDGFVTRAGLLLVAKTLVMVCPASPGPAPMPVSVTASRRRPPPVFSGTVTLLIGSSVGGWLTGVTIHREGAREAIALPVPLLVTVTVIVAVPLALAAGVKLSVPVELPGWCR